jgi:hypothetical protein
MRWFVSLCWLSLGASSVASAQEIQAPARDRGALVVLAPGVMRLHALDRPSKGLLIGAALGAGAGVLLGSLACHQDVGSRGCTGVALRIGILGLGVGGAFGALIGSAGPASEPR